MRNAFGVLLVVCFAGGAASFACSGSTDSSTAQTPGDAGGLDVQLHEDGAGATDGGADTSSPADVTPDTGKVLAAGLIDPIPYLSRADSPFNGVAFPSYFHFEDWEDATLDLTGCTPDSTARSSGFGGG